MCCIHRFHDRLIPDWPIKYLFVGTFNPEWNGNNNAKYFYGRRQNKFWEIMPRALGHPSQIAHRDNPERLENFLRKNNIGLTDLILALDNADENNPSHRKSVLSFKDEELLRFELIFNEAIFELINKNVKLLRHGGVFLTRKTMPPGVLGRFWGKLVQFCNNKTIVSNRLVSPSLRSGLSKTKKITIWSEVLGRFSNKI